MGENRNTKIGCFAIIIFVILIIFGIYKYNKFEYEKKVAEEEAIRLEEIRQKEIRKNEQKRALKESTGLYWSEQAPSKTGFGIKWHEAVEYCKNLNEDGFSDWRLPTISELRSLVTNCSETEIGGKCKVTDKCLNCWNNDCKGCNIVDGSKGKYSKLGDDSWFWSSSINPDLPNFAWYLYFSNGSVNYELRNNHTNKNVRCVRNAD